MWSSHGLCEYRLMPILRLVQVSSKKKTWVTDFHISVETSPLRWWIEGLGTSFSVLDHLECLESQLVYWILRIYASISLPWRISIGFWLGRILCLDKYCFITYSSLDLSQLLALIYLLDQCIELQLPQSPPPSSPWIQASKAIILLVWMVSSSNHVSN